MKNKYKNNADAIKYLSILQDREAQKPVEEMDCELISSCVKILLNLQGKKVSLTEKEIEEKVRKISFAESSDNVKEFKVNKNVRTKTTQKRILLIAAVIAILVAILSFVSVAYEWNIIDSMKEKFGSVHNVPVGEEQFENGVTFINNGNYQQYKSLSELTKNEELKILLPTNLPNDITIEHIAISNTSLGQTIDIIFSDKNLFFTVIFNSDVPDVSKKVYDKKISINSIDCYIETLTDVNVYIAEFSYNGNYYKITYNDMQILLDIIENLEEQE